MSVKEQIFNYSVFLQQNYSIIHCRAHNIFQRGIEIKQTYSFPLNSRIRIQKRAFSLNIQKSKILWQLINKSNVHKK
jgi:hypothetical protein